MNKVKAWRTKFGEEEVDGLVSAITREKISQGSITADFEAQMAEALGVPYAVATTSGSVALLMTLMAHGIGRGDEVIIPNRTFIATAHAAILLGAKVRLVDVKADRPLMDVKQIFSCLSARTKAIIPVHLNGRACDMDVLRQVADEYDLLIIEDACQALFSSNELGYLGTQGDAGCFSLGMTKLMSTGQGGLVVTRNEKTYRELQAVRNHGNMKAGHTNDERLGFNFKYTDFQASLGLVQHSRVKKRVAALKAIYERYHRCIADLPFIEMIDVDIENGEIPLYIEVLSDEREKLHDYLQSNGIESQLMGPSLNASKHLNGPDSFNNSKRYEKSGLQLPSGPDQNERDIERVIDALHSYTQQCQLVAA